MAMIYGFNPLAIVILVFLILWSAVWKGIALWKSGRNNQIAWFVVMFILSTAGILPIIYLAFFQRKSVSVRSFPPQKKEESKTKPKLRTPRKK